MRSTLLRHLLIGAAGLGVVLLLSGVVDDYRDLQLATVCYTACAVAGLTVLTGLSGQISLGHGALMAVGAYATALLLAHEGIPLAVVLLLSTLIAGVVGIAVGAAAARLRGPYLAGATLAFAVGLPAVANWRYVSDDLGGANGLTVLTPAAPGPFGELSYARWQLWVCALALVLVLILLANLKRSAVGRNWAAVRDDEVAASLAGLSVARWQVLAFAVSAVCAGLAGALLAYVNGLAAPGAFPLTLSLQLLAAAVLGGLGTLSGALIGSVVVVFLPSWSADAAHGLNLPDAVTANLPLAVYGVVLIVVMLVLPNGAAGTALRALHRRRRATS